MTTQLNSKLLTLNFNRKQKRTLRQKGFTLIELMVVTAVAGVLGAVAVPQFLGARDIANAKAQIAAAVGVGKECQTWIQSGGTALQKAPDPLAIGPNDPVPNCTNPDTAGTVTHLNSFDVKDLTIPLRCLDVEAATATGVTINISDEGIATCIFS